MTSNRKGSSRFAITITAGLKKTMEDGNVTIRSRNFSLIKRLNGNPQKYFDFNRLYVKRKSIAENWLMQKIAAVQQQNYNACQSVVAVKFAKVNTIHTM